MQSAPFKKVAAPAAEIVARAALPKPARKLLRDGDGAPDYLGRLVGAGLLGEAVKFMAHALPRRESTWLACLAARAALPAEPEPEEIQALEAAERWVFKPGEESRQAAMAEADAPDREPTPSQLAASAAAWSGGSLAPPDAPEVPPGEHMTPTAVYTAVMIAAFATEPERAEAKLRRFLDQAVDIANGGSGRLDKPQPGGS